MRRQNGSKIEEDIKKKLESINELEWENRERTEETN